MTLVAFTDPATKQEFSISDALVMAVLPAPREMWGQGGRSIIQTSVVQADEHGKIRCTGFIVMERYSQVIHRLGGEVAADVIEAEQRAEDEARQSPILIPDSSVITNIGKRG